MKGPTRAIVAAAFALMAIPVAVGAQPWRDVSLFQGRPITSITLNGPTAPERSAFEETALIRPGDRFSAVAIRHAVDELERIGDWTDIRFDAVESADGIALTVTFIARLRISRIDFRGNGHPSRLLRKASGLGIGDIITGTTVSDAAIRIRDWYADLGYDAEVVPSLDHDRMNARVSVVFRIREGDRRRLRSVRFPGTPAFSRLRQLLTLWPVLGGYMSRQQADRAVERLERFYRDKGYLGATIGPGELSLAPRGVTLTIPVQKGPRYAVDVTGYDEDAIVEQMTFFADPRDDEDSLTDEAERLTRFLSDQGYRRATVRISRRVDRSATIRIRVDVVRGPRFPLREVRINGNIALSDQELGDLLSTRPSGRWRKRFAAFDTLDLDRGRIVAAYRALGFSSTRVNTRVDETTAPAGAVAVFTVEEGPQTRVGEIVTVGAVSVSPEPTLVNYGLIAGAPYVESKMRAARATILEAYNELGHIYAEIKIDPTISADGTRADIRIDVVEGPAVTIGTITLEGNDRTRDRAILRELEVHPGDVFNPRRVFESRRLVSQLGFLGEVRLEPVDPDKVEDVKPLRLSVRERDAGSVDLGLGYANYDGPRGFAEITYRNLMGMGRRGTLRVEGSRIERKTVLSYRHPWLFERRIDGKASVYNETREEENRNYQRSTYGISLGIERKLTRNLFGSLIYDFQVNHFTVFADTVDLISSDEERANIASLTPILTWDRRDDPFNPKSGYLMSIAFESASLLLGSQEQFWKFSGDANAYRRLGRPLVLAIGSRMGVASRFGETRATGTQASDLLIPLTERFYVGGRSSVRGYDEDTVGRYERDPATGAPIVTGGNLFAVLNAELRVSLPKSFGLVAFWDAGTVWQDQRDVHWSGIWSDLTFTTGIGLRYHTPVGPLRLDYGHKLDWNPGERHGTFHFTLGHAF